MSGGDFITEAPPDVMEPFHFEGDPSDIDRFYCNRGGFAKPFRIALKDVLRSRLRLPNTTMSYPIEISCQHEENGKPYVVGRGSSAGMVEDICVSLSHKDAEAVAIAADAPVGIDIEKIEDKDEDFLKAVFTEGERALLGDKPQPDAVIRFWVAKEACAKKTGEGLITSPKRFEVSAIDGDVLVVGDERVQTKKLGEEYLVGWTL